MFKEAFITPIVKKAGLDATNVSSYRPISNLSVMSKLRERLVARQLMQYLSSADLLPSLQSGFQLKPPSCEYFPTYYRVSTAVIQLR